MARRHWIFLVVGSALLAVLYGGIYYFPLPPDLFDLAKKIWMVLVLLGGTWAAVKITTGFVRLYAERQRGVLPSTSIFIHLTRLAVLLIGALIILQSLGISITPILTALGVGGLAVALALQETLSNLFAGIHILVSRKVRPGDFIKLDSGEEGYVVDITWRSTAIRQLPNNMVIVPNAKLAAAIIVNYHQPETELAVLVQVGVSYDSDLEKVERVTIAVAKGVMREVPGAIPSFEPFIRYHTFADFSINFTVILRAREFVDQYLVKHEFVKRLHARYQREGIEIPFPIRTVHLKNP